MPLQEMSVKGTSFLFLVAVDVSLLLGGKGRQLRVR